MRISDWSSDVCSSDLGDFALDAAGEGIVVLDQPFERTKALGPEQRAVGLRYSIGQAVILVRPGDPAAVAAEAVELDTAEIIAGIIESGGEIGFRVTDDPVEIGITGDRLPGCRAAGERGSIGRNAPPVRKIGRASSRERGCQYVLLRGVAVSLKKKIEERRTENK